MWRSDLLYAYLSAVPMGLRLLTKPVLLNK